MTVDEPPKREDDTNIEDFDGTSTLRSQPPKSVAGMAFCYLNDRIKFCLTIF